jgi:flagellar basal body-associated protein FliL
LTIEEKDKEEMKMKKLKKLMVMLMAVAMLFNSSILAFATEDEGDSDTESSYTYATDEEKDHIRAKLSRYYADLKLRYSLTDEKKKRLDKIYNSGMSYMANAYLTVAELETYEGEIESYLKEIVGENTDGTEKFLMLSNEVPILSASYNEQTFVVLSLINLGKNDITDVVVTPTVSNDKTKWPFNIEQAYDAQCIQIIQASDTTEEAYNKRMDIGWYFTVRSDVLTGCYPLTFHATYYQNGALVETDITTYINIKGSNPDKLLIKDEDDEKETYNPRIIVTGYKTEPEEVYAGSVFELTVSVKNTSSEVAVENVLFNLEATVEGTDSASSYSAFLPTSGSNAVYVDRIGAGQTYEMSIEMEAKSDLAQKPYVLTVNMKYDVDEQQNLSDTAHVSIPIKQESKLETGSAEVMPESIAVGDQSNVMFSVFNTGKTTLYNVKVTFESDTVDEAMTYLGNISSGSTGNVDAMVTGIAPDETGEGIVTAVITYEDESGNETRFEKEINLYVYEESYEDNYEDYYPDDYYEETESSGISVGVIVGIIVAVVIVIIIVVIVIKKKKDKKKDLIDDEDDL